jgi:hypothetical protein
MTYVGASIHLDWIGTAIYLYSDGSAAAYNTSTDGAQTKSEIYVSGLLFSKDGMNYRSHTMVLQVTQGIQLTSVSGAIITVGMGEQGLVLISSGDFMFHL